MSNELSTHNANPEMVEKVLIGGDLSKLTAAERLNYYQSVCSSIGLNPLTRPFDYINLNGRLTLYAKKDAADQLRKIHGVSIGKPDIQFVDGLILVTVSGKDTTGREDSEVGVVKETDMRGDKANAIMKAVTKAKRRLTLSLCGLGWLDETEVETIPDAQAGVVDVETGQVLEPANGNGHNGKQKEYKFPNTASREFFDKVQEVTGNYYKDAWKMTQVISGKAGSWFDFGNEELYAEKLSLAVDHARKKKEENSQ